MSKTETRVERLARLLSESEATRNVKNIAIAELESKLRKEVDELEYIENQIDVIAAQLWNLSANRINEEIEE